MVALPAAGHTPGQIMVAALDGDETILIAGDSSYTEDTMVRGVVDGVAPDDDEARETLARIAAYAAATPTIYLTSHDPETAARLADRATVGRLAPARAA